MAIATTLSCRSVSLPSSNTMKITFLPSYHVRLYDRGHQPFDLAITARDDLVIGVIGAGTERVAEVVHVIALIGNDAGEGWRVLVDDVEEKLCERNHLCQL